MTLIGDAVMPVADARAGLSGILRSFRAAPESASVVTVGSHRRPEAVIVPFERFRSLAADVGAPSGVLGSLQSKRSLIKRLAALSNITDVAVFGSVARGSETASSDVDLLVTLADGATLFDLAQFEIDMEQLTERSVDAVSRASLDSERDAQIVSDAVPLW